MFLDLLEKKLNSSKKKNTKKPGILTRPINPDFLKNAVQKNDGIEIITNQPLLPIAQNHEKKYRKNIETGYQSEREEISLRNFLESKRKEKERSSPAKSIVHVTNDIEYVQKSLKTSPKQQKSYENNSNQKNERNKDYTEVMDKMNQIIIVIYNIFLKK